MSTVGELFAPGFINGRHRGRIKGETFEKMAKALGVDSLRYLDVEDLAETIGCGEEELCLGW
jgi:glutamine phosphoribosylpyrophosphate amidotransferase